MKDVLKTFKNVDVERVLRETRERGLKLRAYPLANYLEIQKEYMVEGEQKENFCGAFSAAYILRGLGYRTHGGEAIDQDYLAWHARVNVSPDDLERLRELRRKYSKPVGDSWRIWYRFDSLPITTKPQELGASAEGVAHAVKIVSGGELEVVPVKAFDKSEGELLTQESMRSFLEFLREDAESLGAQLILNLNTSHLLDSEKIPKLSEHLLLKEPIPQLYREPVGHFVSCGGLIEVDGSSLLIIRETYQRYGVHLQPAENVRKALCRGDGREGGILVVVPSKHLEKVEDDLKTRGLRISLWDNGSPFRSP